MNPTLVQRCLFSVCFSGLTLAVAAFAQDIRPGDERPELRPYDDRDSPVQLQVPSFEPEPREPGSILPQIELPGGSDVDALQGGVRVLVHTIRIRGNTALSDETIEEIAQAYAGRELSFVELQQLRDRVTLAYVERGYVTSGAVIPEQSLADGELEVRIIEGRLGAIEVETDGRIRPGYLSRWIRRRAGTPVNVNDLQRALQILQRDDRFMALHVALRPGATLGSSVLRVRVVENRPIRIHLAGNNFNSPAVGSGFGEVRVKVPSVVGVGDSIFAEFIGGEGLRSVSSRYEIPISPWDTTLAIHAQATWSKVVEKPFDDLGIKSRTRTYGVSVTQPIHRSRNATVYAFATGEYRESRSYLLGQRFSFLLGPVDGLAKEAVLRFGGDAFYSSRLQAVAARSMFSLGIDALGATKHAGDTPDGQFFAWLGQLQWARRFPSLGDLSLIARGDVQLSDRPLLGLEQFAIGGRDTVRGYRENLLVRDNGLVGGLEVRVPIPLPRWREFDPHLELAPFVDAGYSWNDDSPNAGPTTLVSVGVGGRLDLSHGFGFQIYWGHPLKKVARIGNRSLQDDGVHMEGSWSW